MAINVSGAGSIQQNLNNSTKSLRESNERLSSGKRLNSAKDDAAALAIVAALEEEIRTTRQASRNISDAVSLANIADGGLSQASEITTRLAELATQSANGTLSDDQRVALDQEFQSLSQELDRLAEGTTFNGQQLLSGGGGSFTIQAGNDSSGNSQIAITTPGVSTSSLGLSGASIATAGGAQSALSAAKEATNQISAARGEIGAQVARLEVANNQNQTERVNFERAASELRDADIAAEVANRAASLIRQSAGVATLAQANQSTGTVLRLLS